MLTGSSLSAAEGMPEPTGKGLKTTKESDILILTKQELVNDKEVPHEDIKRVFSREWMRTHINKGNNLLAIVHEKAKKGVPFLSVKTNPAAAKLFFGEKTGNHVAKVYVYLLESLSTSVREYRTLRLSEFYGAFSPLILNPS